MTLQCIWRWLRIKEGWIHFEKASVQFKELFCKKIVVFLFTTCISKLYLNKSSDCSRAALILQGVTFVSYAGCNDCHSFSGLDIWTRIGHLDEGCKFQNQPLVVGSAQPPSDFEQKPARWPFDCTSIPQIAFKNAGLMWAGKQLNWTIILKNLDALHIKLCSHKKCLFLKGPRTFAIPS